MMRAWHRYALRRAIQRLTREGRPIQLNFGAGDQPVRGWVNLDLEPAEGSYFVDGRRKLPFEDHSVTYVFGEHFIEHLGLDEGLDFLKECHRILRLGGGIRLSTPDLALLMATYLGQNPQVRLADALERHRKKVPRAEAITAAMFFNDKMRHWGHRFIYDCETLVGHLEAAGFGRIDRVEFGKSEDPRLRDLERHADVPWMKHAEPLILEATRE